VRHLSPDRLTLIALGDQESDRGEAAHLASCADCRDELTALRHVAVVGARTQQLHRLPPPPPRVWRRIHSELRLAGEPGVPAGTGEAPAPAQPVPRQRRWRRLPERARLAVVAAAAAAVAAGGALAIAQLQDRGPAEAEPVVTAQAALEPEVVAPASAIGQAEVLDEDTLHLHVTGLAAQVGYHEVWLIDPETGELISVGLLGAGTDVFLPLPANVDLGSYRLVDVSAEQYDGDPGHSGVSLLRGELRGT
jgi:anti-sigma-K factor RskA